MDKKNKKDLAKIALSAFILSASLPATGHASSDAETRTYLAGGGCGAASGHSQSSCGASTTRYSPQSNYSPHSSSCGASHSPSHSCGAATNDTTPPTTYPSNPNSTPNRPKSNNPVAMSDNATTPRPSNPKDNMNAGSSSYQGTTTGPGPNDGYPGTPRGSYNTDPTQQRH